MINTHPALKALHWFLLANLLLVRFFRPIFPLLNVFSFRLWIDWVLLASFLFNSRARRAFGVGSLILLAVAASIVAANLLEHGLGETGIQEAANLLLVLSVPLFYAGLATSLGAVELHDHKVLVLRFLNWYFFGNALFIWAQFSGWVAVPAVFIAENSAIFDHLTGLLGLNGVSTLNFVWIATIAGNVFYARSMRRPRRYILAAVQIALAVLLSSVNDNKMFLLTAAICAAFFLICNGRALRRYVLLIAVVIAVAVPVLIDLATATFTTAGGRSLDLPSVVLYDPQFAPNGNNERALLNFLAYRYYNAGATGIGLGHASAESEQIHEHIGINSASLLLIQGGVPLLLSGVIVLTIGLRPILGRPGILATSALVVFSAVLLYASNPIDDRYTLIAVCLFVLYVAPGRKVDDGAVDDSEFAPTASNASVSRGAVRER